MFSIFVWDPNRIFFTLPLIEHPIAWYGVIFSLGFLCGYFVMRYLFTERLLSSFSTRAEAKVQATSLTDRLTFLIIIGTLIGARLGHVFFYEWSYFKAHPLEIFMTWKGGLSSHGGALGVLLALIIFVIWHRKRCTFFMVFDLLVIPTAFVGGCIRVGNFINQEILGYPTTLPWGVTFLHPAQGPAGVPLHPVQLYESLFYFTLFATLFWYWKRHKEMVGTGVLCGWFLILLFGFRFFIEFLKLPQSDLAHNAILDMGQWLSLPFILLGLLCFGRYYLIRNKTTSV